MSSIALQCLSSVFRSFAVIASSLSLSVSRGKEHSFLGLRLLVHIQRKGNSNKQLDVPLERRTVHRVESSRREFLFANEATILRQILSNLIERDEAAFSSSTLLISLGIDGLLFTPCLTMCIMTHLCSSRLDVGRIANNSAMVGRCCFSWIHD